MSFDFDKFQQEAQKAENEAKAAVAAEIDKVRDFYRKEFEKAQEAAIKDRDPKDGPGESPDAFANRVATVPGSFSDRNQTAVEVANVAKAVTVTQSAPEPQSAQSDDLTTEPVAPVVEEPPVNTGPDVEDSTKVDEVKDASPVIETAPEGFVAVKTTVDIGADGNGWEELEGTPPTGLLDPTIVDSTGSVTIGPSTQNPLDACVNVTGATPNTTVTVQYFAKPE